MKVSLEWISDFIDLPAAVSAAELAHQLTLKTVEVEDVIDAAAPLQHVVAGRVIALEPHSSGGFLSTCDIGLGKTVTVVSQTSNLSVGMVVALALPGARLAAKGGGTGTTEIKPVEIAGTASEGVICTAGDLRLERLFPGSHNGDAVDLTGTTAQAGTPLAQVLGFDDTVLEIDNKSLTNRPDLWGHYGIARELAAIYSLDLKPLAAARRPSQVDGLIGDVDTDVCRRLALVRFSINDADGPVPMWLRSRLARIGESSINLCVDLSNYVMFTVGQPTHVYDAGRIVLPLSVSRTTTATKLELLTGASHELPTGTPVIRDVNGPVAVAGVIGGSGSAVGDASREFVLEVANFRPQPIRRASQQLAIRTEASARFEKALDTQRVDVAVDLFLNLLSQVAPNATAAAMQDVDLDPTSPTRVEVDLGFLNARIGHAFEPTEVVATLGSLGFTADIKGNDLLITAPTWRSTGDISLPHDIVEEVARIHGYDNIAVAPLTVALKPVRQLNRRSLDRRMREQLATRASMQEVITYPWVADHLLLGTGFSKDQTVRFEGAPAPDRDSLRPSLIPNLLETVAANLRYRKAMRVFEVGTVFTSGALTAYREIFEPLPQQRLMLAACIAGLDGAVLFRQAKGVLQMLERHCHLTDLQTGDVDWPAWADQSARAGIVANGSAAGAVGLLTKRCKRVAEIEGVQVVAFELDLNVLSGHPSRDNRYEPIPELPEADFDLSVVVADEIPWNAIKPVVTGAHELVHRVEFVDEFRGIWVPAGHRSVTLRVTLRPEGSTLTADVIGAARADALAALERQLDARPRE